MAGEAPGTVIVPWYATGFRQDQFGEDLNEIAAVALRYGAKSYAVYRSRDDRYKYQQLAEFDDYMDWQRYWDGPELIEFRIQHSGWYQVPQLYGWWDRTVQGHLATEEAVPPNGHGDGPGGNGFGHGNGQGGNGQGGNGMPSSEPENVRRV